MTHPKQSELDEPPKGVIFGRATGFVQNRINIIVQNYRGRTLNRELALMNLEQHGVTGDEAEKLLGDDAGPIVAGAVPNAPDDVIVEPLRPREILNIPSGRESVKGRRDGDPPGRRFK